MKSHGMCDGCYECESYRPAEFDALEQSCTANPAAEAVPEPADPAEDVAFWTSPPPPPGGEWPIFTDAVALTLDAPQDATFAVDRQARTISGMIVPYGVPARSRGILYQFSQGTLTYSDPARVKLWILHDQTRAVGYATRLDDRPEGMFGTFKVANTPEGDLALQMADPQGDRVWDGFSIGLGLGGRFRTVGNVQHAITAPLIETSLTPAPSFDDARVHQVAASADLRGNEMPCTICGHHHAEGVACPTAPPAGAADFTAITDAITAGFAALTPPPAAPAAPAPPGLPARQPTPAAAAFNVTREELPYRFDGIAGSHGFIEDLRDSAGGVSEAKARLTDFLADAFAVTSGNAAALNPTENRPELYVPNLTYSRPLWDLCSTGSIDNKTPFTVPKFSSASGLVGNHSEGVEPTPGAFAATPQTVTPAPVSGKIEINREVWDQGGSPQADAIIWGEMVNAYYEAIEARIANKLGTIATAEVNLAGAVDAALVSALTNYFAGLQFVRGGNRFTAFAADDMLFKPLVAAKDTAGRPLLPVVSPVNAPGSTSGAFDAVQLGTQTIRAAWALTTTVAVANARKSYNFVPSSVWAWASAPQRFTFEYQIKSIDMAVWGYGAEAVLRDSDVQPVDYTTADV